MLIESGVEEIKICIWSEVRYSRLDVLTKYLWENFLACRSSIASENLTCSANNEVFIFVRHKKDGRSGRYSN